MRFPKIALLGVVALSSAVLPAQDINLNLEPVAAPTFSDEQVVETFGWFLAHQNGLVALGFSEAEIAALARGMSQAVKGGDSPHDLNLIGARVQEFIGLRREAAMDKMRMQGLQESATFMTEVRKKEGVIALPNGSAYEVVTAGTGPKPREDQVVAVHYTGRLISGAVFDSSEGGEPVEFTLDGVIPGWREGLVNVNEGSKVILYIPPHLAYGDAGTPEIPPASTLIFEVELISVKDAPVAADAPAAAEAPAPNP